MRALLDACVWGGALGIVRAAGHDAVWAGDWIEDPGDPEIIARAAQEGRILITLDKDFGELAVVHQAPHGGIVRLVGFRAADQGPKVVEILKSYGSELERGAIVTVEPGRVRVRPAESVG